MVLATGKLDLPIDDDGEDDEEDEDGLVQKLYKQHEQEKHDVRCFGELACKDINADSMDK